MSETPAAEAFPQYDPMVEPDTRIFWEGTSEGRLMLPRCPECGDVAWMPRTFCARHPRAEMEWFQASGRGTVYSVTRVHRGEGAFAPHSPYLLAYVELEEGPRVLTNLVAASRHPGIDDEVRAVYDRRSERGGVLRFELLEQ